MNLMLLAAAVPTTVAWSPKVGAVMIVCNILAIAFAKATMSNASEGPAMPSPAMFGGMGLPAVLASTSFGHIIGIGTILAFARMGAL